VLALLLAPELAAGLGEEHVVERRRVQLEVAHRGLGVERAHDLRELSAPPLTARRRPGRRGRRCRSAEHAPTASRSVGSAGFDLERRAPDLGLELLRRAAGDDLPWSMIAIRSASTSASSRYCVVRKTVTPSSRARCETSLHMSARLEGSRPVVGSSRKRIRGLCTSASARSRPALHAARVAADLAVGRVGRADALEQRVAARRRSAFGHALQRRSGSFMWSRPGQQRVQRGLLQRGADRRRGPAGPSRTMSWPATARRARGGRQQGGEHQTVVDLPAPLGPRKP
jgi:hypothetical protein